MATNRHYVLGLTTRQANPRVMVNIAFSWVIMLPCVALIRDGLYAMFKQT